MEWLSLASLVAWLDSSPRVVQVRGMRSSNDLDSCLLYRRQPVGRRRSWARRLSRQRVPPDRRQARPRCAVATLSQVISIRAQGYRVKLLNLMSDEREEGVIPALIGTSCGWGLIVSIT